MQVMDMGSFLDSLISEFIGVSVGHATLHSTASKEDGLHGTPVITSRQPGLRALEREDFRSAADFLKTQGCAKVGVTGFCMGGALTCIAAATDAESS